MMFILTMIFVNAWKQIHRQCFKTKLWICGSVVYNQVSNNTYLADQWIEQIFFGLTMSLPEEESEHAEDDEEWCWGLGRKTGEEEEESALRGEEVSLWSSTETSNSLARSCSQVSTSRTKQNTAVKKVFTDLTTYRIFTTNLTLKK